MLRRMAVCSLLMLTWAVGVRADSVNISQDLGTTHVDIATSAPRGSYTCQAFFHDTNDGTWPQTIAPSPVNSQQDSFDLTGLPLGHYDAVRLLLFAPGYTPIYDQTYTVSFDVTTTQIRVTSPLYILGTPYVGSDNQLHCPWTIKFPANWPQPLYNGVWVMAKGDDFFVQGWTLLDQAKAGTDPIDDYLRLDGELVTGVPPTGVHEVQGGAFTYWWSAWSNWVWPGPLFEVGGSSWVPRCITMQRPTVYNAMRKPGHAPLAIGGNLGNYTLWGNWGTYQNYADPSYFKALKALGIKWLRENFDPDRYLTQQVYRDIIRSHVEAMWMAGIVPVLAPQDEPTGDTLAQRDALLVQLDTQLATDYKAVPHNIILENCNEPHAHPAWSNDWKPVAVETLQSMRHADPQGHFWTACESWSSSTAQAERSPLPKGLCESYDVHAYCAPQNVAGAVGTLLPVVIGEYHDTSSAWHAAVIKRPNVHALGAWAWSEPGQDYLALVQSQNGARLTLQPEGNALASIYDALILGAALP